MLSRLSSLKLHRAKQLSPSRQTNSAAQLNRTRQQVHYKRIKAFSVNVTSPKDKRGRQLQTVREVRGSNKVRRNGLEQINERMWRWKKNLSKRVWVPHSLRKRSASCWRWKRHFHHIADDSVNSFETRDQRRQARSLVKVSLQTFSIVKENKRTLSFEWNDSTAQVVIGKPAMKSSLQCHQSMAIIALFDRRDGVT